MIRRLAIASLLLAAGCTQTAEQSTPTEEGVEVSPAQLKDDAKSIEQAADEAVKLIEAEAKAETDQQLADKAAE